VDFYAKCENILLAAQTEKTVINNMQQEWGKSILLFKIKKGNSLNLINPLRCSLRIQPPLIRSRYYVRNAKTDVCDSPPEIPY